MEEQNKSGFDLPQDYFNDFEDRLLLRMMEDGLPKSAGFKAPEGYFETFEDKIADVIDGLEDPKALYIFRYKTLLFAAAAAACLLLIFSLFDNFGTQHSLEDIPASTVEEYLNQGNLGLDTYDLLALMDEEEIEELMNITDMISAENLESYLIENLEETSYLIDQQ